MIKYAVITENDVSEWKDQTGVEYHYPSQYRNHLLPGTKVIYYKGRLRDREYKEKRLSEKPHYFGTATIGNSRIDPESIKDRYAAIENFQHFAAPLIAKINEEYLEEIPVSMKSNYFRNGVRPISEENYFKIISLAKIAVIDPIHVNGIENLNYTSVIKEGQKNFIYTTKYERNSELRNEAIRLHGLTCKACKINFEERYGIWGKGFIHIHHKKPLFQLEEAVIVNPLDDLIPVCPNCHSMIHRRKDKILTVDDLIQMLNR